MSDEREPVRIHVRPDGSLKVYGDFELLDVDGRPYDLEPWRATDKIGRRVKLCRCGNSGTMPFCDESHTTVGFTSSPRVDDDLTASD